MKPIGRLQTGAGNLRSRSNGRRLSGFGAILVVLGALPSWWTLGGGGTPAITGNAFDSIGVFAFFSALALLAILIAPDAVGEQLPIDAWPLHVGLVCAASAAFLLAASEAAIRATGSELSLAVVFAPLRAPGLWVTLFGLDRSVICGAGEWRAASRCIGKSFATSASATSSAAARCVACVVFVLLTNAWSVEVARLKVIK